MTLALRKWATPTTAATFLITGVTGVVLFFHSGGALTRWAHEWIGFAVMAAVGAHLMLNWRPVTVYLKRPLAVGILVVGLIGTVVTSFDYAASEGAQGVNPGMVFGALERAPISAIAAVAGMDTSAYLTQLAEAGLDTSDPHASLSSAAGGNTGLARRAIAIAFSSEGRGFGGGN